MFSLLYAYLVENRSLVLAGVGELQLLRQPAVYDVANQLLQPPHTTIQLLQSAGTLPDSVVKFISSKLNTASDSALTLYHSFCGKLLDDINNQGSINWPRLGTFSKDVSDEIVFTRDESLLVINKAVPAVRILRIGKTHAMVVGDSETTSTQMLEYLSEQAAYKPVDRWWIPALIISVAAMILIILRKMAYL